MKRYAIVIILLICTYAFADFCVDCVTNLIKVSSFDDFLEKTFNENNPVWYYSAIKRISSKSDDINYISNISYMAYRPYRASKSICRTKILENVVGHELCENEECRSNKNDTPFRVIAYESYYIINKENNYFSCDDVPFEKYIKVDEIVSNDHFEFIIDIFNKNYQKWKLDNPKNDDNYNFEYSLDDIDLIEIDHSDSCIKYRFQENPAISGINVFFIYLENDIVSEYEMATYLH